MKSLFSSPAQLTRLTQILTRYMTLPFFEDKIPGAVMEAALASVREAEVLRTYDFVDVIDRKNRVGWQVKSTQFATPLTWKRAKIPDSLALIDASRLSPQGLQNLGDAILGFCNHHARQSLELYDLDSIGYSRLILNLKTATATYFEHQLCTRSQPLIFHPEEFVWHWTASKVSGAGKKEQLSSLQGIHGATGKKWFACHGLGENQLHFSGERVWWPQSESAHQITFAVPPASKKLDLEQFIELLSRLDEV